MDFLAVLATWAIVSSMEKDKDGFLQESAIHFSNLKKNWNWKLEIPAYNITVNNLFKFQAQDSGLE